MFARYGQYSHIYYSVVQLIAPHYNHPLQSAYRVEPAPLRPFELLYQVILL